jgi:hypothetical protein
MESVLFSVIEAKGARPVEFSTFCELEVDHIELFSDFCEKLGAGKVTASHCRDFANRERSGANQKFEADLKLTLRVDLVSRMQTQTGGDSDEIRSGLFK